MLERVEVAEVAQVYQLWNEYAAAANAGDLERWLALWADDAIQMPPGVPCLVGKAEIRSAMQSMFDQFDTSKMVIQAEEIRVLPGQAYAHGTFEFQRSARNRKEATRYCGKFLDILEKQIDGSWKIAIDCHNYDTWT
jgi:uncharacterized protein (TIGR02246 family)